MEHEKIIGTWIDPLARAISLSLGQWLGHIIQRHPDMAVRLEYVGKTIEELKIISRDKNALLYFQMISRGPLYLKVVVGQHTHSVITAYRTREIQSEGGSGMAKKLKFDIDDDTQGDIIDIFLGKPYETDNYDIDSRFTLRFNPRTKKLVGLIILQFSSLFPNVSDPKSRRLVVESLFKMFDLLYREKALKEDLVV